MLRLIWSRAIGDRLARSGIVTATLTPPTTTAPREMTHGNLSDTSRDVGTFDSSKSVTTTITYRTAPQQAKE